MGEYNFLMSTQKSRKDYVHVTHIKYHSQQSKETSKKSLLSGSADISNLCEFYTMEGMEKFCSERQCDGQYKKGMFCYTRRK